MASSSSGGGWQSQKERENNVDDRGDEREGGTGAGGSLEVPWRRWLAAVVVEEDPFHFLDDSAI